MTNNLIRDIEIDGVRHIIEAEKVRPCPKPTRVSRKHKAPKSERKRLEKRLDDIVREIVLERDGFCVLTGHHAGAMQCGHLVTRAKRSTRWDLINCNVQCAGDNLKHEYYPEIYTRWFLQHFGVDEYKRLCADAESIVKLTIEELETLHFELTEIRKLQQQKTERGEIYKPHYSQKQILTGEWKKGI